MQNQVGIKLGDEIKLNLGCGGRPLEGYINVDMDDLSAIKRRYPHQNFRDDLVLVQYDLFNLPYENDTVDEIRAEGLVEHLPFKDEPRFFYEIERILKPGGILYISTVDFEMAAKQWLLAKDDWQDFYRDDADAIASNHWFGTHTYEPSNRWGYLTATFYGSQNGDGQFHTNCYSEAKLRAICKKINLEVVKIEKFQWKGNRDHMLGLTATKR
ncbi:methyltransferase domain-containing protein [Polynucleobacter sp. AP-Sanab-80-C2]|uniref:class I SAM-dependent methyltransferase n=1 Tax=Polynucleobacter sp. AP-Sanab-80-C2 TaxID=3108274 RepID=UPI002B23CEE6|nr:methyltransferase domain-containing protein [Polynucleobacter sp. AP-Sanab-80-C2]MEA9598552.1 methyltransferase domain-containing protein [Polynucleobacter sp. AP-Sanab-80-C2]